MSLIRSLFERVVDTLRGRPRAAQQPQNALRGPRELLKLGQAALRKMLLPPHLQNDRAEHAGLVEPAAAANTASQHPAPTRNSEAPTRNSEAPTRNSEAPTRNSEAPTRSSEMAESTPRTPRPEAPAAAAAASEGIARIAQLARDAGILGNAAEPTPGAERAARQGPPAAAPGATGPAAPEAAAVAAADVVAKAEKDDGLPRPLVPPPHPVDTDEPGPPTRAELAKFSLGPESASEGPVVVDDLDADLAPLAEGYGDRRLFLLPRSPEWLLAMWDFTNDQKDELRRQGGAQLGLRVYDVSPSGRRPPKDHACDELAREYYIPAEPDRRYAVELGYWTRSGGWLSLGRSHDAWTPPSGPRPGPVVFATVPYERVRPAGAPPRYQLPGYVGGVEHGQGQGQGHSSLTQEVAAALDGARRSLGLIRGGPAGPSSASSNRSGTATTSATTTSASSPGGDASGSDSSDAAAAGEAGAVVYPHPLVYPGPEGPLGSSMGVSPSLPPGPGVGPLPSSPSSSWSR